MKILCPIYLLEFLVNFSFAPTKEQKENNANYRLLASIYNLNSPK